jgi:hypothetical protein
VDVQIEPIPQAAHAAPAPLIHFARLDIAML